MMRRIGGSALSPKIWTQRSTPFARMILSLLHRPNLGTLGGRLLWSLDVVAIRHNGSLLP